MRTLAQFIALTTLAGLLGTPSGAQPPNDAPVVLTAPSAPAPREASFKINDSFTAQRRPRVAVLDFADTNMDAQDTDYGDSVEAMLVTFLKRKSQFVVVERQKINSLLEEKERIQLGKVRAPIDDPAARALLEKIDVFVFGNVTLLNIPTTQETQHTQKPKDSDSLPSTSQDETQSRAEKRDAIQGPRIEIDAKLISRFDGRIIAVAQRSGPVACLRSIIERLGIALEQEYLRPYYGRLTVTLDEPERIQVFLTPILPMDALDEEKPPVERGATVTIGSDHDKVEAWMTDPTTYTIENLLSGWYSMRIERPGYVGTGVANARWEVRKNLGKEEVYDRVATLPLDKADPSLSRFIVRVDPLSTEVVDGRARQFSFRKEGGSIAPVVKRQYLDESFSHPPQRVLLFGGKDIEINTQDHLAEYADDARCDLFDEETPSLPDYGRTYVAAGQPFDFDQFTGGELIIEDYHGEIVPVGRYTMALWEPSYHLEESRVTVRDHDDRQSVKVSLTRETAPLDVGATGQRPTNLALLEGRTTRLRVELPLDFSSSKRIPGLPVDTYLATTSVPDLTKWKRGFEIPSLSLAPPIYNTSSKANDPKLTREFRRESEASSAVTVKTRFGLAGHFGVLSRRSDPLASETFVDPGIAMLLDRLLNATSEAHAEAENKKKERVEAVESPSSSPSPLANPGNAAAKTPAPAAEQNASPQAQPILRLEPSKPVSAVESLETLRDLLAERLENIDLLVLNPDDMVKLRKSPEVAGVIARWISAGGSLFAFVSTPGDYRDIVGASLSIESLSKKTRRFNLSPGTVPEIVYASKKKMKSKSRRQLPELTDLDPTWRVLAYTKHRKGPRIIERGARGNGGYVAIWFDDPEAFRGHWGGTRPEVEQTRANVEAHVFRWARDLMRSRFGGTATEPTCPAVSGGN